MYDKMIVIYDKNFFRWKNFTTGKFVPWHIFV